MMKKVQHDSIAGSDLVNISVVQLRMQKMMATVKMKLSFLYLTADFDVYVSANDECAFEL